MKFEISEMILEDYQEVLELWEKTPGLGLTKSDSQGGIEQFLDRNPGLSFVARQSGNIIGAVLCGHDGRRGYLHHVAVDSQHRNCGVGRELVAHCLGKLKTEKILKCHLFVYTDNDLGRSFWKNIGWVEREELGIFSKDIK